MYIITRIPQVAGETRFIGAATRKMQRATQQRLDNDPAMIDGLTKGVDYSEIRDCNPGARPAGWSE